MKNQAGIFLRAGLWGGPLFIASLLVFGALTPGYSHLHKAVSRLGAWDNPWGLWFDLFGLFIPGLFAVGVAIELRRRLRVLNASTHWATGLLIYSVMMALTAVPADFSRMFNSPWTWAHAIFVLGNGLVLLVVVPGCAKALRTLGASSVSAKIFFTIGYLTAVEFLLYGILPHTPGFVQRVMIFTAHFTTAWMSWTLLRLPPPRPV